MTNVLSGFCLFLIVLTMCLSLAFGSNYYDEEDR